MLLICLKNKTLIRAPFCNKMSMRLNCVYTKRDLIFGEKRQEALEKKLGCKFIRINTSKLYDEHYETETDRVQTFISKFKNRK